MGYNLAALLSHWRTTFETSARIDLVRRVNDGYVFRAEPSHGYVLKLTVRELSTRAEHFHT